MMRLILPVLAGLLALNLPSAKALDIPRGAEADARVKTVDYNEHDVVAVYSYAGIATQVVFGAGEEVLDIASGFGDGWEVLDRRNMLYIKPKSVACGQDCISQPAAGKWDTNLIVTTNKHLYVFQLFLISSDTKSGKLEYDPRMAFRVQFKYPALEAAERMASAAQHQTSAKLATSNSVRNLNYTMKAGRRSDSIAPISAYDDGTFTYLRFAANSELPSAYLVNGSGDESMVNTHMSGDTLVLHSMGRQFVLRLGKQVVSVFNEDYKPVTTTAKTGTTVPGLERQIRGASESDAPVTPPMEAAADLVLAEAQQLRDQRVSNASRSTMATTGASLSSVSPGLVTPGHQAADTKSENVPAEGMPKWTALAGAPVKATLETWLPEGWTLAWDATSQPRGVEVTASGDVMTAIRALFATRMQWDKPLAVRFYREGNVLQVVDAPMANQLQAQPAAD